MSIKNYTANDSFYMNENRVRSIVQMELQEFFSNIKDEIQQKIRQIDRNILQLKQDIRRIQEKANKNHGEPADIANQLIELEHKIEEIRKYKERQIEKLTEEIRNRSIDRSYDRKQERSPLFRKNPAPTLDLNNILFGDQNIKLNSNSISTVESHKIQQSKSINPRPPLPKIPKQPMNQSKSEPDRNPHYHKQNYQNYQLNINQYQYRSEGEIKNKEDKQERLESRLVENLSKNKNSFMRKKSLKKIGTIPEEEFEQSMLSTS